MTSTKPRPSRARLATSVLLLAALGCGDGPPIQAGRTNVLWLTLCTVRADRLGAYGHPTAHTPTLDRMAEEGVLFESVLAPASWTRPSIASMITGVYPRALDIEDRESWPNDRGLHESFPTLAERFRGVGYETFGVTANPNTNAAFGFDRGYDHYRDTGQLWRTGYSRNKLTAETVVGLFVEWLGARSAEAPFFAHLVFVDAHTPYRSQVARNRLSDGANVRALPRDPYDLQIQYLDEVIGGLWARLLAVGLEDTMILVTSDHGEGLGDRGPDDRGHGRTLFHSRLSVPFIVHHPALPKPGTRVGGVAEVVDMAPTVIDLLGIPAGPDEFDGVSLRGGVLDGAEPPARGHHVAETAFDGLDRSAISSGPWKLIVDHRRRSTDPDSGLLLYRRSTDPLEITDVSATQRDVTKRLLAELAGWQEERGVRIPVSPERGQLEPHEVEALRSLGYIDEGPEASAEEVEAD